MTAHGTLRDIRSKKLSQKEPTYGIIIWLLVFEGKKVLPSGF